SSSALGAMLSGVLPESMFSHCAGFLTKDRVGTHGHVAVVVAIDDVIAKARLRRFQVLGKRLLDLAVAGPRSYIKVGLREVEATAFKANVDDALGILLVGHVE